jgi:hypothetical protein
MASVFGSSYSLAQFSVSTHLQQRIFSAKYLILFLFLHLISQSGPLYLQQTPLFENMRSFKDEEDNFYFIGSIILKLWKSTSALHERAVGNSEGRKSLGKPIFS